MPEMPDLRPFLEYAIAHRPLTFLVIGLLFAVLVLASLPKPHTGTRIVDVIFGSYLFWTIGVFFLAESIAAGVFGADAASAVHLPANVQTETAGVGLAFAVIAFLALGRSTGLRVAAVVGPAIYWLVPLLGGQPSPEGIVAHGAELVIILLGALLLLLQDSARRDRARPHLAVAGK